MLTLSQKDKRFVFEEIRIPSKEPVATAVSTQEWLDALVRARDLAVLTQERYQNNSYSENNSLNMSSSALSSQPSLNMVDQPTDLSPHSAAHSHSGRGILHKQHSADGESLKNRKRFSKRQSKSGLTAVF